MKKKHLVRNDIIVAILCIIFSLLAYVNLIKKDESVGSYYEVYENGKLVAALQRFENTTFELCDGKFVLEIKDGTAKVIKSNCKDKTCMSMICNEDGGNIICLPNRIVVKCSNGKSDYKAS